MVDSKLAPVAEQHTKEFDQYADNYEAIIADPLRDQFANGSVFFHQRKIDVLMESLQSQGKNPSQLDWLDMGCGKGDLLSLGAKKFRKAFGCDVSTGLLAQVEGVEVRRQTSDTEVPFDDNSVDVVTAACVYHHIEPAMRLAITKSVYRALRPGGMFCIFEHNPLNPVTRKIVARCPLDVNAILLPHGESDQLMHDASFKQSKTVHYLFLPEGIFAMMGAMEGLLKWLPIGGQYAAIGIKSL